LRERCYPFVLVDAFVLKIREDGRVRSRSAMIAIGINTEGYREVLGLMLGDSESEASWSQFFSWLKSRNLRGVELVVSDDHGGLVQGGSPLLPGCYLASLPNHFMRNIMDATLSRQKKSFIRICERFWMRLISVLPGCY